MNTRFDIFRRSWPTTIAWAALLLLTGTVSSAQTPAAARPAAEPADYAEFRKLLDAQQYEEAAAQARKRVDAAALQAEAGDELQVALMNLAVAQHLGGDYAGAEESYLRVIELIDASGRRTNPRLARAQAGLASTYYAGKRYDLAAERFEIAVALSRRTEGLFNDEQLPLLEQYADTLTELNRMQDALRVRSYALRVVERKDGPASLRYALELESLGRWYARVRAYDASRASLRRAIEIVEDAKGANAIELIGPLTALGDCARRQLLDPVLQDTNSADDQRRSMFHDAMAPSAPGVSSGTISAEGQKALERAVAIASNRPDPSPIQVADVRTQLGDWYQSRLQFDRALPNYQLAWQAASGAQVGGKPLTELLFARPVLLHYLPPDSWDRYSGRPAGETTVRNVQVEFTVTAQGRVVAPRVIAEGGDAQHGARTVKAAAGARYRPRFDKGQPVDTPAVRLDQPFYVLVETEAPAESPKPGG